MEGVFEDGMNELLLRGLPVGRIDFQWYIPWHEVPLEEIRMQERGFTPVGALQK
jgi:hypothetical protein